MIHSALRQVIDRSVTPEELRDALERPIPPPSARRFWG
jgi:hypothetical protein